MNKNKNTFAGEPEGFVKAAAGVLFLRKGYKFYIKHPTTNWILLSLNSEVSPSLTNDTSGKIWIKTTQEKYATGWEFMSIFSGSPAFEIVDTSPGVLIVGEYDTDYLILDLDTENLNIA